MNASIEKVQKLLTVLVDTKRGYEEALEDQADSELAPLFREMIALRDRDCVELHNALSEANAQADESGSFMSAVQKIVIDVRSALTGLHTDALPSFIRGEESVIAYYDDALNGGGADPRFRDMLVRQKAALQDKIARMKQMQAA